MERGEVQSRRARPKRPRKPRRKEKPIGRGWSVFVEAGGKNSYAVGIRRR